MIVTWSFLAIAFSIGLIFLGIKMAGSVKQGDIKIFFLGLYFITLLTFFNLGSSFYFYAKTIQKRGQKGPKGLQGPVGDKGESGYCESSCKSNSLRHFLIKKIKEYIKTADSIDSIPNLEQTICGYVPDSYELTYVEYNDIEEYLKTTENVVAIYNAIKSEPKNNKIEISPSKSLKYDEKSTC